MLTVCVELLLGWFCIVLRPPEQTALDKTLFPGPHAPDPIIHKSVSFLCKAKRNSITNDKGSLNSSYMHLYKKEPEKVCVDVKVVFNRQCYESNNFAQTWVTNFSFWSTCTLSPK